MNITKGEYVIDGSGELVHYPDPYQGIDIDRAQHLENYIRELKGRIETHFLLLGRALSDFEEQRLYLGRGYPTFRTWCDSPEINIGYRAAHDLIRIVNELLPIFDEANKMEKLPSMSTMRELLPVLADDDAKEKIVELVDEVHDKTLKDAKILIRESRGQMIPTNTVFRIEVQYGEEFHRATWWSLGERPYEMGSVRVRRDDWKTFSERFGRWIQ